MTRLRSILQAGIAGIAGLTGLARVAQSVMPTLQILLSLGCLALMASPAMAHKPSDSYLSLRAEAGSPTIAVRWDIALRDLDYVLQLDRDGDGQLTWGEVRGRASDIEQHARERLALASGGQPCTLQTTTPLMLEKHSDGTYAVLSLRAACTELRQALDVRYSLLFDVDPMHRGLVQWTPPGAESPQARVFAVDSGEQALPLAAPSIWDTIRQYTADGVWHIWIGFDHILSLLALLLPAVLLRERGRWTGTHSLRQASLQVIKVVTAFTVAHSITLTLASLEVVTLPSRLVESVIAASVVLAALANLVSAEHVKRWVMAFVFGLIHGFGFASVLSDLGLPASALVVALIGFNVGVELGQLAIVAGFVPVAFALRNTPLYRRGVLQGGSLLIALLAGWWYVERAFGL